MTMTPDVAATPQPTEQQNPVVSGDGVRLVIAVVIGLVVLGLFVVVALVLIANWDGVVHRWNTRKLIEDENELTRARLESAEAKDEDIEATKRMRRYQGQQAREMQADIRGVFGISRKIEKTGHFVVQTIFRASEDRRCSVKLIRRLAKRWYRIPTRITEDFLREIKYTQPNVYPILRLTIDGKRTTWVCRSRRAGTTVRWYLEPYDPAEEKREGHVKLSHRVLDFGTIDPEARPQ